VERGGMVSGGDAYGEKWSAAARQPFSSFVILDDPSLWTHGVLVPRPPFDPFRPCRSAAF
jgi:hypothetical protein